MRDKFETDTAFDNECAVSLPEFLPTLARYR
jgi:hypothetical protein